MFCPKCGTQLPDHAKFCAGCGHAMPGAPMVPTPTPAPAPVSAPVSAAPAAAPVAPAPTKKKKSKKGLVITLIAIVLVLALAAVACFVWPGFLADGFGVEAAEEQADSAVDRAEAAMADKDYESAVEAYTAALEEAEDNEAEPGELAELYAARAEACVALQDYEAAAEDYEAALELDDSEWKVWNELVDCYRAMGENGKAVDALKDGIDATGSHRLEDRLEELNGEQSAVVDPAPGGGTSAEMPGDAAEAPEVGAITIAGETFSTDESYIYLGGRDLTSQDLEPLRWCTELVELDLSSNNIDDLSVLGELTSLEYLYLGDNEIWDLSPLENLQNLEQLYLNSNEISDLRPLSGLPNLRVLDLYDNEVFDAEPLVPLQNLEVLILWENPISDVRPLGEMTSLYHLDLDNTLVSDISPLFGLVNLEILYLSGPNLPDDAWEQVAEHLPNFSGGDVAADTVVFGWGYNEMFYEFEAELATILFDISGSNGEIWQIDVVDELFMLLEAGEVDAVIGALSYTEDRAANFEATIPYYTDPETGEEFCIYVPAGDPDGLLPLFNEVIVMLQEDGTLQMLSEEIGLELTW